MTFLEIVRQLFLMVEGDAAVAVPTDVETPKTAAQSRAIEWVKQANHARQSRKNWTFRERQMIAFQTQKGVSEYEAIINDFDEFGFYIADWNIPIVYMPSESFFVSNRLNVFGAPTHISKLGNGKFGVYPIPDRTYTIGGIFYLPPTSLTKNDDVPPWDSDLHEILVWDAAKYYAEEYNVAPVAIRIAQNWPMLERQFLNRYSRW